MLQDTDFFEQLGKWSTVGDVHATVEWSESPSPDERYTVGLVWRFRKGRIGHAEIIIEPVLDTGEFQLFWINIEFVEAWQDKGLYSELIKAYMDAMPEYQVTGINGSLVATSTVEAIHKATGFEWNNNALVLDFTGERIKEWRAYKDGKADQPKWRHDVLADAGLLDASETI